MNVDIQKREICLDNGRSVLFDSIYESVNASLKDVIYLGGSIIEGQVCSIAKGMGNLYSDIDVFIIRDHNEFLNTSGIYEGAVKKTFFCENYSVGLDIEVFDRQYVESLIKVLESIRIDPTKRFANYFKEELTGGNSFEFINSFLCRLKNSICIYGKEEYKKIYKSLDFSKFLDLMSTYNITRIDNVFYDVEGNLAAGQLDTALNCIRRVLIEVMGLVLMNNGYFFDRDKWVFLKFKNLCNHNSTYLYLYQIAFEMFRGDLSDDLQCSNIIKKALKVSKQTIESVLLGGIEI